VTGGRLLLGGQAEPTRMQRLVAIGPGGMLAFGAGLPTLYLIEDLISGQFTAANGTLLGAAIFGALFARFVYDFHPRRAWLEGTVLTVEGPRDLRQYLSLKAWLKDDAGIIDGGAVDLRRCDLASASVIKLRRTLPPMARGYGSVPVLYARQEPDSLPARLLLRRPDLLPFPADHLRMLAHAIDSRPAPHDKKTRKVIQRLQAMAEPAEPIDMGWSFRTDPRGRGRPSSEEARLNPSKDHRSPSDQP
jgi:hypothetical protein